MTDLSDNAGARLVVGFDSAQAEAVLTILDRQQVGGSTTHQDWERLFETDAYVNLKKRECQLGVGFSDEEFKRFLESPALERRAADFRYALTKLKSIDLARLTRQVREYLPNQAHIRARIFLVIKPKANSFVYDSTVGNAVFLYVDPGMTTAQVKNLIAHELHHIGLFDVSSKDCQYTNLSPHMRNAVNWMAAFGEGLAMLAAAGGPDIHPHAVSRPGDRARWDRDMANFSSDLKRLDRFFLDIVERRLTDDEVETAGYAFYGVQGPWYTVGWKMAAVVESHFGRKTLLQSMLDPRLLLVRYNDALSESNSGLERQALWSMNLISAILPGDEGDETQRVPGRLG